MTWTLEFSKVGGDPIGRITYDGKEMKADPGLEGIADADDDPQDVVKRFDGWSNGYVQAQRVAA
jgi:hypothetical protein